MEKYAVIVAAGSGTRMGISTPKQFLLIHDKPLLWHSIEAFFDACPDITIILVLAADQLSKGSSIVASLSRPAQVSLVAGGETRFQSVKNGLGLVPNNAIVFIHDAVRCLVTKRLIERCLAGTLDKGNAIPAVPAEPETMAPA